MSEETPHPNATLMKDEEEIKKIVSQDILSTDYNWILRNVSDFVNVYSNNNVAEIMRDIGKDVNTLMTKFEERNTWIFDNLKTIGIMIVIWSSTDRFAPFWKKPWLMKHLFKNPEPQYFEIMGPHQTIEGYEYID